MKTHQQDPINDSVDRENRLSEQKSSRRETRVAGGRREMGERAVTRTRNPTMTARSEEATRELAERLPPTTKLISICALSFGARNVASIARVFRATRTHAALLYKRRRPDANTIL